MSANPPHYNPLPLEERMAAVVRMIPGDMDATGVVHLTIPAVPRCKVTLRQMAKGVQWECEYTHEDPTIALEVVNDVHQKLAATYGGETAE